MMLETGRWSLTRVVRVGVAVDPPLLADLLVSLLASPHRRMALAWEGGQSRCDVAIVSPAHLGSISAPRIIRLPGDCGEAGVGSVTTVSGSFPVPIRSVEALKRLLKAYLAA